MQVKVCSDCRTEKPLTDFHRKGPATVSKCKPCQSNYIKAHYLANQEYYKSKSKTWKKINPKQAAQHRKDYRDRNPDYWKKRDKVKRRSSQLYAKYGITNEHYNQISELQGHVCATCKLPESRKHQNGNVKALAVDHCHTTGEIRGLLCADCNMALGLLKDNLTTLSSLMSYLIGTPRENYPDDVKIIMRGRR